MLNMVCPSAQLALLFMVCILCTMLVTDHKIDWGIVFQSVAEVLIAFVVFFFIFQWIFP